MSAPKYHLDQQVIFETELGTNAGKVASIRLDKDGEWLYGVFYKGNPKGIEIATEVKADKIPYQLKDGRWTSTNEQSRVSVV